METESLMVFRSRTTKNCIVERRREVKVVYSYLDLAQSLGMIALSNFSVRDCTPFTPFAFYYPTRPTARLVQSGHHGRPSEGLSAPGGTG